MAIKQFKDKTVLITGASAGVGAACAREFASLGATLLLVARGQEALEQIASELRSETTVYTYTADVGDIAACDALIKRITEQVGVIQVVVNNAGVHYRGDAATRSPFEIANMVDVNLRAPLYLSMKALPGMLAAGSGAIIMVGSLAGRAPLQGAATYGATKAGLRSFAYALADETRDTGIAVGIVSPGPINTGFIMDNIDDVEDIVYSQPMSTAQQVAENVVRIARGERIEIAMPWLSGKLTTLSYLSPWLRRATRGAFYALGRRNKDKYRNR